MLRVLVPAILVASTLLPTGSAVDPDTQLTTQGYLDIFYADSDCFYHLPAVAQAAKSNTGHVTFSVEAYGLNAVSNDNTLGGAGATYPVHAPAACPRGILDPDAETELLTVAHARSSIRSVSTYFSCASGVFTMTASNADGTVTFAYGGAGACSVQ